VRGDRPSLTASVVAAIRAFYSAMPDPYDVARDPVAERLVPTGFAWPAHAVALAPRAAPRVHRAVGALTLGLTWNVALRTRAIDDAVRHGVAAGATQLVLLGAGLDARAERLRELADVRVFEVDHPSTQRYKSERLALRGRPPLARSVARVAVDFERDRLEDVLPRAGLDPRERSFWIWEGVTMYLTPDAIAATLAAVAALAPPGSRLAVTYARPGRRRPAAVLDPMAHAIARAIGEPLHGMMDTPALNVALARGGFAPVSDESAADWVQRYWPGETVGFEWERLAIAERADEPPR
jgi:methyltransferase (TIGR00027 family)